MVDVRKILIIFVIGILYAIFVHSFVDAVHPAPEYEDYCGSRADKFAQPRISGTECKLIDLPDCEGFYDYEYDANGCQISATCNMCEKDLDKAREEHNLFYFILSSIFGLFAIALALYLPVKRNELNEWIGTGFMLGGILSIFIATAVYYGDMTRILRPVVMLIELIIVVYLAYKKIKT